MGDKMQKVDINLSIVLPVYNVENFVADSLNSIVSQLNQHTELIIVNDGSTDESEAEILKVLDTAGEDKISQIKYFKITNLGLSGARNYGRLKSVGRYIWFIDSDDVIHAEAVNIVSNLFDLDTDLIHIEVQSFDENDNLDELQKSAVHSVIKKVNEVELLHNLLTVKIPSYSVSYIVKKEILDRNDIWFKEGILFEDMQSTYKVFESVSKAIEILNYAPYLYRVNINGITKTISKKSIEDRIVTAKEIENHSFVKIQDNMKYIYLSHIVSYIMFDVYKNSKLIKKVPELEELKERYFKYIPLIQRLKFGTIFLSGKNGFVRRMWLLVRKMRSTIQ